MSDYAWGMVALYVVTILYTVWRSTNAPWSEIAKFTITIFLVGMMIEKTFSR